jgi:hypothetical protein
LVTDNPLDMDNHHWQCLPVLAEDEISILSYIKYM